jgi:hypothetical protein
VFAREREGLQSCHEREPGIRVSASVVPGSRWYNHNFFLHRRAGSGPYSGKAAVDTGRGRSHDGEASKAVYLAHNAHLNPFVLIVILEYAYRVDPEMAEPQ